MLVDLYIFLGKMSFNILLIVKLGHLGADAMLECAVLRVLTSQIHDLQIFAPIR